MALTGGEKIELERIRSWAIRHATGSVSVLGNMAPNEAADIAACSLALIEDTLASILALGLDDARP